VHVVNGLGIEAFTGGLAVYVAAQAGVAMALATAAAKPSRNNLLRIVLPFPRPQGAG
jgi:hypothetical protein